MGFWFFCWKNGDFVRGRLENLIGWGPLGTQWVNVIYSYFSEGNPSVFFTLTMSTVNFPVLETAGPGGMRFFTTKFTIWEHMFLTETLFQSFCKQTSKLQNLNSNHPHPSWNRILHIIYIVDPIPYIYILIHIDHGKKLINIPSSHGYVFPSYTLELVLTAGFTSKKMENVNGWYQNYEGLVFRWFCCSISGDF